MNPARLRVYIMLIATAAIWGVAGPVIKYTLGWFEPGVFLSYRFFISTVVALVIIAFTKIRIPKEPKLIFWTLVYSLLTSTVALGILFLGYKQTSAIDAGLIGATAPLFVATAGVLVLKEHLTKREMLGIGIAFAGTTITILEPMLKNGDGFGGVTGNLLVLLSVLVGTSSAVLAKKLLREKLRAMDLTNFTFIIGFLTILPITLLFNSPGEIISQIRLAPVGFHLGVFYMALLSGTLAYYWWTKAEKSIEIGEVGVFAYLYPLFGTPVAVLWLKEKLTLPFIMGAVIIAVGVIIAEYKKSNLKTETSKLKTTT